MIDTQVKKDINSIDISVDFSFQGVQYTPVITIDLDIFVQQKEATSFHRLIANQHEIDCYSYLYEVLESSAISYANPQGIAVEHMQNDHFDLEAYIKQAKDNQVINALLEIAQQEMNISDFTNNQSLKNALLQAYRLGNC